jgi:hypothetical protein
MCLACAVPVRGRVLGAECLASALGPDVPAHGEPVREPGAGARAVAGSAFAVAALATVLPWSRFGPGAEAFGAWSTEPRWSVVAAVAALAGLVTTILRGRARTRGRAWEVAGVAAAGLVIASSILSIARPPAFASPWLGPWVALGCGVVALVAGVIALVGAPDRRPAHV